jgi:hypothetical protein
MMKNAQQICEILNNLESALYNRRSDDPHFWADELEAVAKQLRQLREVRDDADEE